jgi:uncharacterized membrane protein YozB (DUF420 family)
VIQRIQHLLLFIAVVLNAVFFFSPLFSRAYEDPASWIPSGIAAGIGISTLMSAIIIFMYRQRNQQMIWLRRALLFQILGLGSSVGVLFSMGGFHINLIDEALSALLPMFAFLFMIIALIYIRKDEQLIRSMDRLR